MKSTPIFIHNLEKQLNGKYVVQYTDSSGKKVSQADLTICCFGETSTNSDNEIFFSLRFQV